MFYVVKRKNLRNPKILSMVDPKRGETWDTHVFSEVVRVDGWKRIQNRCPGEPWRHMRELYGTLDGKTVLISGSGHTLTECPKKVGIPSFAVNRSIRHLKADYWCVSDKEAYLTNKDHPNAKTATIIANCQLYESLGGVPCFMVEMNPDPWRWPNAEDRPLYWNETTTGWAIHLALRMGAARAVLIGQDAPGRGMYDGHLQEGRDFNWQLDQHYGVMERMLQMFSPSETEKWMERPFEVLDASGGYLPCKKVKLADYV